MHLTNLYFYSNKNYFYSKLVNGLEGYGVGYPFGFNGQEKDDEVSGVANTMTATFWEYDSRLGRRWNLDPKPTFGFSDYSCFIDNPIRFSDPNGDKVPIKGDKKDKATLIKQLNDVTGGDYKINWRGKLKARNGNYGNNEVSKLTKQAIKAKNDIPIHSVSNDDETYFDSYYSTKVDVGDLNKADLTFKKGIYAHFLSERLAAKDRYSNESLRFQDMKGEVFGKVVLGSKFEEYHNEGLKSESIALAEALGLPKLEIRKDGYITSKDVFNNNVVHASRFIYGNNLEYNVNITPKTIYFDFSANNLTKMPIISITRIK